MKSFGASAGAAERAIKRRRVSMPVPPWSRCLYSIPRPGLVILGERSRLPVVPRPGPRSGRPRRKGPGAFSAHTEPRVRPSRRACDVSISGRLRRGVAGRRPRTRTCVCAELSAARGPIHPAVRAGERRRHHRPAHRGSSRRALGQAGRGREPPRRRRPRRDQRVHQRQRRPHAVVRAGLHVHGASLYARQACRTTSSATCFRS